MNRILSKSRRFQRVCIASLLLLTSCGDTAKPSPRPNIILVTVDTLRTDHLSCYGYPRATTPTIDALASKGIVFANAYAPSSWTAPSMASLFTGLYPREHGVIHYRKQTADLTKLDRLADEFHTLAEALKDAGYRTHGVSANAHVSDNTGFAQGFDTFRQMWFAPAEEVTEEISLLRDELLAPTPYFLFAHYIDPHDPYRARSPWIDTYARDIALCRKWEAIMDRDSYERMSSEFQAQPASLQALIDLYDSEISYCDASLEDMLSPLMGSNTVVIIMSDHGEGFLEHGHVGHGHTLYEEVLRVPLVVYAPHLQQRPRAIDRRVCIRELYRFILGIAGLSVDPDAGGLDFLRDEEEGGRQDEPPIFFELTRSQMAMLDGPWKLIHSVARDDYQLFHIEEDPGELTNVYGRAGTPTDGIREALHAWADSHPQYQAPKYKEKLTAEELEVFRALGYLR